MNKLTLKWRNNNKIIGKKKRYNHSFYYKKSPNTIKSITQQNYLCQMTTHRVNKKIITARLLKP